MASSAEQLSCLILQMLSSPSIPHNTHEYRFSFKQVPGAVRWFAVRKPLPQNDNFFIGDSFSMARALSHRTLLPRGTTV